MILTKTEKWLIWFGLRRLNNMYGRGNLHTVDFEKFTAVTRLQYGTANFIWRIECKNPAIQFGADYRHITLFARGHRIQLYKLISHLNTLVEDWDDEDHFCMACRTWYPAGHSNVICTQCGKDELI